MKRSVPNSLSISRIVLSFILLLTVKVEWLFAGLVLLIGLTDIADGYIARRYHLVSKSGARLDSVADLIFFTIIFWIIYLQYFWILRDYYGWLLVIVLLKIASAVISRIKFGEIAFIHTLANKATGFLIFLSIVLLPLKVPAWLVDVVFVFGTFSAGEELLIMLLTKNEVDRNQKSIVNNKLSL